MRRREQYLMSGPGGLGEAELVALILETGSCGRTALQIAAELVERAGGAAGLARMQPHEWTAVAGMGAARAVRLHAALELGRRAASTPAASGEVIPDAEAAFACLGPPLRGLADEELHALFLDRRHRPVAHRRLTRGNDALTVVDPRQVFRIAVGVGASAVILAHNHPSGDPTPSSQDRDVTDQVARAGRVLGIPLLDHLVVGGAGYRSIGSPWRAPETVPRWTG
ncbi:MAG: DNA repair protein RadC [Myxococcota bacterium]